MALSGDTSPGFAAVNSRKMELVLARSLRWVLVHSATPFLPLTALHKVGIVASYSYNEIVKPEKTASSPTLSYATNRSITHTVHLVLILHKQERVKVQVTKEPNIRPNR